MFVTNLIDRLEREKELIHSRLILQNNEIKQLLVYNEIKTAFFPKLLYKDTIGWHTTTYLLTGTFLITARTRELLVVISILQVYSDFC